VQPRDAAQVAAVLRLAGSLGLTVVPFGGGTAIDLGNLPRRTDIVLDLTRLDALVEHRPQDLTVTAAAGITIATLQARLAEQGQMLALDPPLPERATLGGVLAANSSGPQRQRFGTARDLVIGSRVLLADGTAVRAGGRVVKNVAGYDLNKLWIGSAGTLAVIVEVTLKVMPLPATLGMLLGAFPDPAAAHAVAMTIARGVIQPLSLDLIGPPAARRLSSGSRAEPGDAWLLAVELGGSPAAVERATREIMLLMTAGGSPEVTALERHQREAFSRALRDFGRTLEDPAAAIVRVSVLPSDSAVAVTSLIAAGADAVIARAGCGVCYGYWSGEPGASFAVTVERLRSELAALAAQVVVERASPATKAALDVWGITGPDREVMDRVKRTYDPADTLSPGRLIRRETP
jgi:glycolate oxidase FAD binding subunit